jgi:hypothetical protein
VVRGEKWWGQGHKMPSRAVFSGFACYTEFNARDETICWKCLFHQPPSTSSTVATNCSIIIFFPEAKDLFPTQKNKARLSTLSITKSQSRSTGCHRCSITRQVKQKDRKVPFISASEKLRCNWRRKTKKPQNLRRGSSFAQSNRR